MTILKKSDKQELLTVLLKKGFEKPFDEFGEKIKQVWIEKIQTEHPRFIELMSDTETYKYIATSSITCTYLNDFALIKPKFGLASKLYLYKSTYSVDTCVYDALKISNVVCPIIMNMRNINDDVLHTEYLELWNRYLLAYREIRNSLFPYKTREKLISDFPEFKNYLPDVEYKTQPLMPIASEVTKKLTDLGVLP